MGFKKRIFQSFCLSFLGFSPALAYDQQQVANLLGWISTPNANLCNGFFAEPQELKANPIPPVFNKAPVQITYTGPGEIYAKGRSVINKDIVVTQPGRIATADKAIIYREPDSGKLSYVQLEGNVQVHEYGKLVRGQYSKIDFENHTFEAQSTLYHIFEIQKNFINLFTVMMPGVALTGLSVPQMGY